MNQIQITDLEHPDLYAYAHASEAELFHMNEPNDGVFIAETANVVLRALEAGYELKSMLVEEERMHLEGKPVFDYIESNLGKNVLEQIPVYVAPHEVVTKLTGYNLVRGLWAVMKRKALPSLEEFCKGKNRIAVLFDVVNPTNVGAIIRSAAALGMDGALLSAHSVNPLTRRSSRVSMGTVFALPWTVLPDADTDSMISLLHRNGFKSVAMALTDNAVNVDYPPLKEEEKLAVILGTEGTGLPKEVIESSDWRVCIPMHHGVDSLNVAAASAVIFWDLQKKTGK